MDVLSVINDLNHGTVTAEGIFRKLRQTPNKTYNVLEILSKLGFYNLGLFGDNLDINSAKILYSLAGEDNDRAYKDAHQRFDARYRETIFMLNQDGLTVVDGLGTIEGIAQSSGPTLFKFGKDWKDYQEDVIDRDTFAKLKVSIEYECDKLDIEGTFEVFPSFRNFTRGSRSVIITFLYYGEDGHYEFSSLIKVENFRDELWNVADKLKKAAELLRDCKAGDVEWFDSGDYEYDIPIS